MEVEGLTRVTAEGGTCLPSRHRVGAARHTSGVPLKTEVEDFTKETIREGVPFSLSWAQVASSARLDSGALWIARVEGPARKVAERTRVSTGAMANPQGDQPSMRQSPH